jgi:hypothetical protein
MFHLVVLKYLLSEVYARVIKKAYDAEVNAISLKRSIFCETMGTCS